MCRRRKANRSLELPGGDLDLGAVVKVGVPVAAALRSEVHKVPDGTEFINSALADVRSNPRMRAVEMAQGSADIVSKNGNRGVLISFPVFASEIPCESALGSAQQVQLAPASRARVSAQVGEIRGGDHREIKILSEVMGDAVDPIEPRGAHRAGPGLQLSEHQVVDERRSIGLGEEFA